jgi:hypothetical protein
MLIKATASYKWQVVIMIIMDNTKVNKASNKVEYKVLCIMGQEMVEAVP